MNKLLIFFVVGVVSVVLTESSQRIEKQNLVKALKEKFKQLKFKQMAVSEKPHKTSKNFQLSNEKKPAQVKTKDISQFHQHEKAASAIGLALLDMKRPRNEKAMLTSEKTKEMKKIDDSEYDFEGDDENKNNKKTIAAVTSKKNKDQKLTGQDTKRVEKVQKQRGKLKIESEKSNNKKQQDDDDENDLDDDEDEDEESLRSDDSSKEEISKRKKEEKSMKNSDKSLKNSVKSLKYSVESMKDKDLQTVNVGDMKKLLATSVENLDKAEKAIHDLLQYDENNKPTSKNRQNNPAIQGYPQQPYGGNQQVPPSTAYQTTCPGQCSSLCAPACRDPCCTFPPSGYNMGPPPVPMPGRGSFQQGLINSYPPQTTLGAGQGGMNQYGPPPPGQQCGSQCSSQSQCAPSCNPSCCTSGGQGGPIMPRGPIVGPGQANSGCPQSCLSSCGMACPRSCCVPGRK